MKSLPPAHLAASLPTIGDPCRLAQIAGASDQDEPTRTRELRAAHRPDYGRRVDQVPSSLRVAHPPAASASTRLRSPTPRAAQEIERRERASSQSQLSPPRGVKKAPRPIDKKAPYEPGHDAKSQLIFRRMQ